MSTRARAQIDTKQPEDSGTAQNEGAGKEARHKPARPWQSLDIDTLRWRWHAAAGASHGLPRYEELALDSLGGLADNVAVVQMDDARESTILMAGKAFESWIGRPAPKLDVAELSVDRARALRDLLSEAMSMGQPVQSVVHGVVHGSVCLYDLVAMPLSNRWGMRLFLVYIHEREQKFSLVEAMFQAASDGLVALAVIRGAAGAAVDFEIAALNDGAARLMGGAAEDLRGRRLSEICSARSGYDTLSRLISAFNGGGRDQFELDCGGGSGTQMYLSVSVSAIGDLVAMTMADVTGLKAREESFRLLFEANPVPMFLCDRETLAFLAVNDAAVQHYGHEREPFLALTLLDIVPQEDREHLKNAIASNPSRGGPSHAWRHLKADGTRIDVLTYCQATLFRDHHAELVAVMDVTEKKEAETRIAYMAQHDALTGLPNRVLFHERLDEALLRLHRSQERHAVLFLDLDHFKNVNDTLGHPIGDLLLKEVAARLRLCMRDIDLVARFGGDEFAVLQKGLAGPHEASALADRIVTLLSEPFEIDGHQIVIGASVGIALAPEDAEGSDRLLKNADMALYRAKEDGRRIFRFFEPEMDVRLRTRRAIELDLRNALVANEFEIHYQPLVNLESGAISGFEALVRWRHPLHGLVPPAQFIPLAEEVGLIVPIGEWVLRQACVEAAAWPDDLKVAVNLSPVQFKNGNVTEVVFSALANAGLPASRLDLEVTETILLEESKVNLATLHKLRSLGVGISMDDFGTGYSGLSYLRVFPFDKIKIDRSFVSELAGNGECMAIVRAIAKLGSSLGIRTTAEGVETAEQREVLRNEGCTEMQGYLLSRPLPANEVSKFLAAHSLGWPIGEPSPGARRMIQNAPAKAPVAAA